MRICHISDLHIRCMKFHREYRRVFEDLYRRLDELKPDLVVNTGDTAHQKTNLSPEFVEMTSEHIRRIIEYAPYHMILGNHDLNLMNADRQDAITPIVESIDDPRVCLHKKSGRVFLGSLAGYSCEECARGGHLGGHIGGQQVNFWVFGIGDSKNYPTPSDWKKHEKDLNIGLFHGSISRCVTDSNWRMTHTEHDVSIFDGLDYVFMGDIHKQQFMDDKRRIGYAGSLIQQNFGEDVEKGMLVWDIESREKHSVRSVFLNGSRKFYTIHLKDDLGVPDLSLETDSRIRISPPRQLTLVEQKEIERTVRKRFNPHDVITLSAGSVGSNMTTVGRRTVGLENLRQLVVQERLLRDWLKARGISGRVVDMIVDLNRRYQINFEQVDETARDISWCLNGIAWSNMFNYGENNFVDFGNIRGLTGIFGENSKGKSSFIDVISEALYDKVTKNITKNLHMINDNKEVASMVADITAEDKNYVIERRIERVKYGQRKFNGDEREWGKTAVDFSVLDPHGVRESLNADLRPGTERNIRQRLGNFDDFMLTSLTSQVNTLDIISCKETERKKILYKFLDLDIFEQKGNMAKEDSREWYDKLSNLEDSGIQEHSAKYRVRVEQLTAEISGAEVDLERTKNHVRDVNDRIMSLSAQKVKVDCNVDIEKARSSVERAENDLVALGGQLEEKNTEIAGMNIRVSSGGADPQALQTLKEDARRQADVAVQLAETDRKISTVEQTLQLHRKKLFLLKEVPCDDQYPECKFLIDAFSSKKRIPSWEQELRELNVSRNVLVTELGRLDENVVVLKELELLDSTFRSLVSRLETANLQKENLRLKIMDCEKRISVGAAEIERYLKAEADIRRNNDLEKQVVALQREKEKDEREANRIQGRLNELNHERGGQETILTRLESELAELHEVRDRCTAFEHYIQAMGKDGIAYEILTQKLPVINEEINKILNNAADFGVVIEHDPEEQSVRLYLQYGEYRPRILELGGGAEKMLASVAIRTALLSISNLPKTNLFIIDEGFGKLDPKNMESVGKMFDYLKTIFEHVMVISHIDTMKDMVDNIIEITSDEEGYSHIEV